MNTKFINEVADYIEQLPPDAFDMRNSGKLDIMNSLPHPMPPPASLSEPACIATYAALLTGGRELRSITWSATDPVQRGRRRLWSGARLSHRPVLPRRGRGCRADTPGGSRNGLEASCRHWAG